MLSKENIMVACSLQWAEAKGTVNPYKHRIASHHILQLKITALVVVGNPALSGRVLVDLTLLSKRAAWKGV